jgi:hypothetical protein
MPPPIQTFAPELHYSVIRELLSPTRRISLGGGATGQRRHYERAVWRFRLHATHEVKSALEDISSFYLQHMGDVPFYFSGEQWGTVSTPIHVGWGTGAQTHYFLPNRHVTGSLSVRVAGVVASPPPTLTGSSGLIVFSAAPAADAEIRASYTCRYKCIFWNEDEVLLSEEEFVHHLFTIEGIVLSEVVP